MTDLIAAAVPSIVVVYAVLNDLASEDYPREGEMISGREMVGAIKEYFGADEVDVMDFPIDWFLDSLKSDDQERLIVAGLVNGMLYLAYKRTKMFYPECADADYTYHTHAALRIRIECRHAELIGGEPSPFRTKIN